MKLKFLFPVVVLSASVVIFSCGGKNEKKDNSKTVIETTVDPSKSTDDGMVPAIDIAAMKDEPSVLEAMQKVVDARVADEKKQKDDSKYSGHYVELTKLYTAVLSASTAFTKTITDPAKAVEFSNKLSAIQEKMYAK